MIRKKKRYSRPRKPFEAGRIKEEDELVKKYGLKNKREIWKMIAKVDYYRNRAKSLARASNDEQELFFKKLQSLGLKVKSIADALDLKVENLMDRRLTTIIVDKQIANTPKQARQLVVHKKIIINNKVMNSPSYIVPVEDENSIELKQKVKKTKATKAENTESAEIQEAAE